MKHKVEEHLGLVKKIAGRYSRKTRMEYDDLFQEGCIGLMKACREYKEGAVPFGAYAGQQITFAILNALKENNPMRVSGNTIYTATKIKKQGLENESAETIAEKLGLRVTAVRYALDHLKNELVSLDKKVAEDKEIRVGELIPTTTDYTTNLLAYHIVKTLCLTPYQSKIIELLAQDFDRSEIARLVNSTSSRSIGQTVLTIRKKLQPFKEEIMYGLYQA